jgi:hypothetical protein
MNKHIYLILALLCMVAQGAWAQVSYVERSWDDGNKLVTERCVTAKPIPN